MTNEKLIIAFSQDDFTKEEINAIVEAFSSIVETEERTLVRLSALPLPPEIIIEIMSTAVLVGIFNALGKDIYEFVKRKVISVLKNKKNPRVKFLIHHNNKEIIITCKMNEEEEFNFVFDTWKEAVDMGVDKLNKEHQSIQKVIITCDKEAHRWKVEWIG